jgi:hypothetical protein
LSASFLEHAVHATSTAIESQEARTASATKPSSLVSVEFSEPGAFNARVPR